MIDTWAIIDILLLIFQSNTLSQWIITGVFGLVTAFIGAAIAGFTNLKSADKQDISKFRAEIIAQLNETKRELILESARADKLERANTKLREQSAIMRIEHEALMRKLPLAEAADIRKQAQSFWLASQLTELEENRQDIEAETKKASQQ